MKVGSIASATFGLIPVQPAIAPIDAVPAIVKHVEIAIPKSNQFINSNFAYTPRTRYYDAIASDPRIRIVVNGVREKYFNFVKAAKKLGDMRKIGKDMSYRRFH